MSTAHHTVLSPSLHDLHTDASVGFAGLIDSPAAEMMEDLGPDAPLGDDELDALWEEEQARRAAEAAAVHPDYLRFQGEVAQLSDQALIEVTALVDQSAPGAGWCAYMGLDTAEARAAWTHAATLELLQRLDARRPAVRAAA